MKIDNNETVFDYSTMNEIINEGMKEEKRKALYKNLWFEKELTILFGETNCGKSLLALQIAEDIAKGGDKVMYFDYEMNMSQLCDRYSNEERTKRYEFSENLIRARIDFDLECDFKARRERLFMRLEEAASKSNIKIFIIYTRVSSSEQVDGQSLEVQIDKCREYANTRSYNIVGEFGGTYESAKSDKERKEFSRMLTFIKQSNKKDSNQIVKTVIVFSTSRFSRTGSTTIIEEVEARGAYVVSATSNYDPRTPVGKYMQLMELANARFQNDEKRATTVENSVKALLKGRWIGKSPRGYDQKTTKKEQIITINEEGKLIRKAFLWKANNKLSNEEIRHRLAAEGFHICKQKLSELFKNPFYCGYMAHKFLQGDIVQGNHPPLIPKEIFLKVNGELSKNHSGYEQKIDKEYAPLLGSIKCPCCGNNLSASISTKMRKKFGRTDIGYYVCSHKGCKYNSSTKNVHEAFEEEVNKYSLSDKVSELLKLQLTITFDNMNKENKERAQSIKSNIKAKEKELEQVETNYALCSDAKKQEICIKVMTRLETEIRGLQVEYSKVNTEILNLDKFIDYAFAMRSNLFNLWELQGLEGRRRLQKLVFPDGFIYDKNNEHIEPRTVNQFFLLNYSFPTNNGDKKRETNSENHRSSLQVLEAGRQNTKANKTQ